MCFERGIFEIYIDTVSMVCLFALCLLLVVKILESKLGRAECCETICTNEELDIILVNEIAVFYNKHTKMLHDPVKNFKIFFLFFKLFQILLCYLGQAESKLEKPCSIAYLELTARDPGS